MFLRFSFLACFTLNTIPQKYLNKGEKQGFFLCGLLVKGPKEMGFALALLSICTKGLDSVTLDKQLRLALNRLQLHTRCGC